MNAGKIVFWDRLELACNGAFAISSSNFTSTGGFCGGSLTTYSCPDAFDTNVGISMQLGSEQDPIYPAGQSSVTIQIPDLGYSNTITISGFATSLSAMVAINGVRLYQTSGAWLLMWSSIEIWANGSLVTTLSAGSLAGLRFAPTGIPLLGIPATISGSAGPNPVAAIGVPPGYTFAQSVSTSGTSAVTGGWRFRETAVGPWVTLPVDLRFLDIPSQSCDTDATAAGVGASNTYNGSVSSEYSQSLVTTGPIEYSCYCDPSDHSIGIPSVTDVWQTVLTLSHNGGAVTLVPNLAKGVVRMGSDYAALIYAGGSPLCRAGASNACGGSDPVVSTADYYAR